MALNLTSLEEEALTTLALVRDLFAAGRPKYKLDYITVMTAIRDTIKHLENKRLGCARGLHSAPCRCKEAK